MFLAASRKSCFLHINNKHKYKFKSIICRISRWNTNFFYKRSKLPLGHTRVPWALCSGVKRQSVKKLTTHLHIVPGLRMCGAITPTLLMSFHDMNKTSYTFILVLHYLMCPVRLFLRCSTGINYGNAIFKVVPLFCMKTHSTTNLWYYNCKFISYISTNLEDFSFGLQ